jgi:hypothetical protein
MIRKLDATGRLIAVIAAGVISVAPTEQTAPLQPIIDVHKHASWPGADDAAARNALLAEMDADGIVLSLLHINEPGDVNGWLKAAPGRFLGVTRDAVRTSMEK